MVSNLKSFQALRLIVLLCSALALLSCQTKTQTRDSVMQWHPFAIDFKGPDTAENASKNPFTHYRLWVKFTNGDTEKLVRGFYAADGNAANTGATDGNIWRVRFSPPEQCFGNIKRRCIPVMTLRLIASPMQVNL